MPEAINVTLVSIEYADKYRTKHLIKPIIRN